MVHLPAAADIATTSADLLFADPVDVSIPGAHTSEHIQMANDVQDRLDDLLEDLGFAAICVEAAETAAALGGVFLRVTWDREIEPDHPILTSVDSDQAVAEFRWGVLQAVTFWRVVDGPDPNSKAIWRQLERHEMGYILHGLYAGTEKDLGEPQPIQFAPGMEKTDWDSETEYGQGVVETGIPWLTAVYIPNMRPNRVWRGADVGRSDYDGVEALMDALDETWTSWMRDLRLGRARIIVPQEYLDSQGKGKGAVFDLDQEVFETLPLAVSRDEGNITLSQFGIRAAEHLATSTALLARIVAAAGYSESTFGLNEVQRGVTATEIISRERRSYVTRDKKVNYWLRPLRDILKVLLAIDREHFEGTYEVILPHVQFADAVSEDPGKQASTIVTLRQAMAASTETLVRLAHSDWTDEQVLVEVQKIMDEKMMAPPAPGSAGPPGTGVNPAHMPTAAATTAKNAQMPGAGGANEKLPVGSTSGGGGDGT
jgi:hypothetical protein